MDWTWSSRKTGRQTNAAQQPVSCWRIRETIYHHIVPSTSHKNSAEAFYLLVEPQWDHQEEVSLEEEAAEDVAGVVAWAEAVEEEGVSATKGRQMKLLVSSLL